ncbi:hypothetical protein DV451_003950 [Geotrichum candidum]|uniref:SH3 domain-containing protein n=1 Tax=Geotrichum candidum TaxID=1173061 RepID=A0A9P5G2Y3_GEOCN|nr:hypothetical protein DV451_003950 [Geotrichum candidum]
MPTPPFTVRAVYPYESDVEGDLVFDANQLITVEVIEDSEWYTGSYTDPKTKQLKSGMFPINFVEPVAEEDEPKDEPEPQPEPQAAPVPAPAPVSAPAPVPVPAPAPVPAPVTTQPESKEYKPAQSPETKSSPIAQSLPSNPPPSSQPETTAAPKKRNAFQDRIAAFNSSSAAPTPFAQPKPASFVKKPFYAAPTNSYVPQIPHIPKASKPTPSQVPVGEIVHHEDNSSEEEKALPKVSLKDRIRLLQEQQQAEAARAEALAAKKKQKKAAKKAEHDDLPAAGEEGAVTSSLAEGDADEQDSLEPSVTGGSLTRTLSVGSAASREEFAHPEAQTKHHHEISSVPEQSEPEEVGNNNDEDEDEDDEEESEEDEEDEEEARKQALRERMAKISGGMGMHLGMIMPGGFGAPAPSKKSKKKKIEEESAPAEPSQAPIPIFPFANPASMPEALQHSPRAEAESGNAEDKEDSSDETESYVEIESKNAVEDAVPSKSEPASQSTPGELHPETSIEPTPLAPQSVLVPEAAPSAPENAASTLDIHQRESFPTPQSSHPPPPPVSQEQPMQSPTSHAPPPPVAINTSAPSTDPTITSPSALHAPAPPAPASERKLDSVIASHKEESDTEESDSAWSDTEPSRTAPRRTPSTLAPPPPLSAPSVPPVSVSSKEADVSDDETEWWFTDGGVPRSVAERKDIVYEIDESQHIQRGGKVFLVRDIYILFADYSQNIITVEFSKQSDHVAFQQRIENAPASLRQEQLVNASQTFGAKVSKKALEYVGQSLPRGEFLSTLLENLDGITPVIPYHSYGALLYKNISNTNVRQYEEILPGDIAVFSNAFFQGHKGSLHQKYTQEVTGVIVGVVHEYDGVKRKIKVYEQSPKEDHGLYKVKSENYRLGDLKNGEVKVFRLVGREFVSWN